MSAIEPCAINMIAYGPSSKMSNQPGIHVFQLGMSELRASKRAQVDMVKEQITERKRNHLASIGVGTCEMRNKVDGSHSKRRHANKSDNDKGPLFKA